MPITRKQNDVKKRRDLKKNNCGGENNISTGGRRDLE
jgi:hypothetical protein